MLLPIIFFKSTFLAMMSSSEMLIRRATTANVAWIWFQLSFDGAVEHEYSECASLTTNIQKYENYKRNSPRVLAAYEDDVKNKPRLRNLEASQHSRHRRTRFSLAQPQNKLICTKLNFHGAPENPRI